MPDPYQIGLLGTGIMGSAMARQLLQAGHEVTVWNRSLRKARPLADDGARIADSPRDAVTDVDFAITIVADGEAVRSVLARGGGLLDSFRNGTRWLQMSTVGLEDTEEFITEARRRGIPFVDAPVLGTREPAEAGELTVLASSDDQLEAACAPIFEAVASRTMWVGEAGDATRLKLVCNSWVVGLLGVLSETLALADGLDVPAEQFLEAISGGALDAGYARIKGDMMQAREYPASFPLRLALKDSNLIAEAAQRAELDLPTMRGVSELLERAVDAGHADEDMAAAFEAALGEVEATGE